MKNPPTWAGQEILNGFTNLYKTRLSSLFYSWIRAHFAQFSQGGVPFLTDFESFIEQKNITKYMANGWIMGEHYLVSEISLCKYNQAPEQIQVELFP